MESTRILCCANVLFVLVMQFYCGGASAENLLPYDTEPTGNYPPNQLEVLAKKVGIYDEVRIIKNNKLDNSQLVLLRAENSVNRKLACAYFDCSAVSAAVTREESDVRNRRLKLEQERNEKILFINTINFLSRGAISAPAFGYSINPQHLPTRGNILGTVANGTSTLLSTISIAEGFIGKSKGNSEASILTPVIFPDTSQNQLTPYVQAYLASTPLDIEDSSAENHRQRLLKKWCRAGLIPDPEDPKSKAKIKHLLEVEDSGLSTSELQKRETMLEGFRTTVLQMTKGLEQLSHWM